MTGRAEQLRINRDDSGIPSVVNGSFEEGSPGDEVKGWFYSRQANVVRDSTTTAGHNVLMLSNSKPGENCHVLQAVGLDGRKVQSVEMSVRMRTEDVAAGRNRSALPRVELTFYDHNRELIRAGTLGPWDGTSDWFHESESIRVPGRTRLAVLVVGMFGATGRCAIDDIQIRAKLFDQ
jgi:protein-L-isoaspartate(D-aspartate) O-methyltransferase